MGRAQKVGGGRLRLRRYGVPPIRFHPTHAHRKPTNSSVSFAIIGCVVLCYHGHIRISLAAHIRYGKTKDYSCSPLDCSHPY